MNENMAIWIKEASAYFLLSGNIHLYSYITFSEVVLQSKSILWFIYSRIIAQWINKWIGSKIRTCYSFLIFYRMIYSWLYLNINIINRFIFVRIYMSFYLWCYIFKCFQTVAWSWPFLGNIDLLEKKRSV